MGLLDSMRRVPIVEIPRHGCDGSAVRDNPTATGQKIRNITLLPLLTPLFLCIGMQKGRKLDTTIEWMFFFLHTSQALEARCLFSIYRRVSASLRKVPRIARERPGVSQTFGSSFGLAHSGWTWSRPVARYRHSQATVATWNSPAAAVAALRRRTSRWA